MASRTEESSDSTMAPRCPGSNQPAMPTPQDLEQCADRHDRDDRRNRETQHGSVPSDKNLPGREARQIARAGMKSPVEAAKSKRPRHAGESKDQDRHRGVIGKQAIAVGDPERPDRPQGEIGDNGEIMPDVRQPIAQNRKDPAPSRRRPNERRDDPATAQSHHDEHEVRDQDHKLHQRPISGSVKAERSCDIGESQAEDRDANDPSDPGLDGEGGLGRRREKTGAAGRTADERPQNAHHGAADDVSVDQGQDRDARDGIFAEAGGKQRIADNGEGGDRSELENEARHDERRPADRSSQPGQPADVQRRGHVCAGGSTGPAGPASWVARASSAARGRRKANCTSRSATSARAATAAARQRRPSRSCCATGSLAVLLSHRQSRGNFVTARDAMCEFGGHFPKSA